MVNTAYLLRCEHLDDDPVVIPRYITRKAFRDKVCALKIWLNFDCYQGENCLAIIMKYDSRKITVILLLKFEYKAFRNKNLRVFKA